MRLGELSLGGRTLLVGGLSTIHDPLAAAALRGLGLAAEPLHPRTDRGLHRARALGNHGQCNPAHYAVGAVLQHAEASASSPESFAASRVWLTVGSCGPCRLAAYRMEYEKVLGGAGLASLPILALDQLAFAGRPVDGPASARASGALPEAVPDALLFAVAAGDAIATLGHRLRPYVLEPDRLERLLEGAVTEAACALERQPDAVLDVLEGLARRAADEPRTYARALPRVLLVGEPWTTLADGDPSYDLARRLALHGAEIDVPRAVDWLQFLLWEAARNAWIGEGTRPPSLLRRAAERLAVTWQAVASAAGLADVRLADMDDLARLAAGSYAPAVRGGSAHLEIGRALAAARDHTAHLVLSLKPFGCLPSSALSDGILSPLLRDTPLRFLSVETTGDADAWVESRLEMALHAATAAAACELQEAAARRGLCLDRARRHLEALPCATLPPTGSRTFACTAAELLARAAESA